MQKVFNAVLKILFNKYSYFIYGIVATILIEKPIEHAFMRYFSEKKLSYEVVSESYLTFHDIEKYLKAEGLDSFNLSLDDPILKNYYLVKLKLLNNGVSITNSLKFKIYLGEESAKLLDIKHMVKSPLNKTLAISNSLPKLIWSIEGALNPTHKVQIIWNAPTKNEDGSECNDLAGYNVYQSIFKDKGYGKINDQLIKTTCFNIDTCYKINGFSQPCFYKVEPIDLSGNRGELSNPIEINYPELLAFKPLFKDAVWIDAEMNLCGTDMFHTYRSLDEAKEKEPNKHLFILKNTTDNIADLTIMNNMKGVDNFLYQDDLKFLKGEADIFLTSGLDENAEISFYILFKILPRKVYKFNLILDGQPEIEFVKNDPIFKRISSNIVEDINQEQDKKASITPMVITSYINKSTIYLLWEKKKDQKIKGVKIYRSKKSSHEDKYMLGEEIYDGQGGILNSLKCEEIQTTQTILNHYSDNDINFNIMINPPLRKETRSKKGDLVSPSSPQLLITTNTIYKNEGNTYQYYYADKEVTPDISYTYTIYAYDDKNYYAYPVLVNASLRDLPNELNCTLTSN